MTGVRFRVVSEEVLRVGTLVTMARATIEGSDGETFERDVVHHPGAVVVVPLVEAARTPLTAGGPVGGGPVGGGPVGGGPVGGGPVGGGPVGGPSVLLVRQYRAAVDACLLELPAGKRDVSGEPPELTARRELEEEVGMRAGRVEELAQFYNSPGFCDEHTHLYLAQDLTPCDRSPQGVEEGQMTIEQVPLEDALNMVGHGGIVDAKTILGLSLVALRLDPEALSVLGKAT